MKILFILNQYQQAGGEDSVLDSEKTLLSKHGHKVSLALKQNDNINSFRSKVIVFPDVAYCKQSQQWMSEQITTHKPKAVHVHNFFLYYPHLFMMPV